MSKEEVYRQIQLAYRAKFLQLTKQFEKDYGKISDELNKQIQSIVDRHAKMDGTIGKLELEAINHEIDQVVDWFRTINAQWLDKNIVQSANLAITSQDMAAQYYIKAIIATKETAAAKLLTDALNSPKNPFSLSQQYGNGLSKAVRDQIWQRRWPDGHTLSDRVWTIDKDLRQNLHGMVQQCVNEGRSAVDFSKAVEQYLTQPGPKWTTAIQPAKTDRGSIKYNALRLARTETNQAYHKAQSISQQNSAIVKGVKWNLSPSHPKEDICDTWATQDLYGLGPGVYPPGKQPEDHPNGLCFLTDVLYEGDELIEQLTKKYQVA